MWGELIIRSHKGPGILSRDVIDIDAEDGIREDSRRGNDSAVEGMQGRTYALEESAYRRRIEHLEHLHARHYLQSPILYKA
jgi:hypothetical protein